jgi:hypothetical protein
MDLWMDQEQEDSRKKTKPDLQRNEIERVAE